MHRRLFFDAIEVRDEIHDDPGVGAAVIAVVSFCPDE